MKIIILGAGQVGGNLAKNLIDENNDITIIDVNFERLNQLQNKFDLKIVHGFASHPKILKEAEAKNADMLVAVTNSDETNMIACQIAHSLFKIPNKVARIRSSEYINDHTKKLFAPNHIPIDYLISPEQLVIDHIYNLIQYPETLQVSNFANQKISIIATKIKSNNPFIGCKLSNLQNKIFKIKKSKIIAIFRRNELTKINNFSMIKEKDEIFFIVEKNNIQNVINEIQNHLKQSCQSIMIAGGGNIGAGLAKKLEQNYNVKLIERVKKKAIELTKFLNQTIVFYGNASDPELLKEELIEQIDIFITLTDNDEINIMSALLAKKMGAKKVIALIQRSAYIKLIQNQSIDIIISPKNTTISALLTHFQEKNIVKISNFYKGTSQAIEIIVQKNKKTLNIINKKIKDIILPKNIKISAILRNNQVIITNQDDLIKEKDHIIIFVPEKKYIQEIKNFFLDT